MPFMTGDALVELPGSLGVVPHGATFLHPADPATQITVTLVIRRNVSNLAAQLIENAQRPASERKFLSPGDLKVDDSAVQSVCGFAQNYGLTVVRVDPERATIDLAGTVSNIDAAFTTALGTYRFEGKEYMGRQGSLTVSEQVAPHIQSVLGLSTFPAARPRS